MLGGRPRVGGAQGHLLGEVRAEAHPRLAARPRQRVYDFSPGTMARQSTIYRPSWVDGMNHTDRSWFRKREKPRAGRERSAGPLA